MTADISNVEGRRVGAQGSAKSANITILSAVGFLVLATTLSFLPEHARELKPDWPLRGTLTPAPHDRSLASAHLNLCAGLPRDCADI